MNIIIETPNNYKDLFTIAEYDCIQHEERNHYPAIDERYGYPLISDFTNEIENDILKISAKWCKHEDAKYFGSFGSCDDLDIIINVYVYDGITFKFMQYYLSDFIRRDNNGYFPKYLHELS